MKVMILNKVLVTLYVPKIEQNYEIWIPLNKSIYNIIIQISKAVYELSGGYFNPSKMPILYNKETAIPYDINMSAKKANIKNGTELILL